ncbi:hypothetical protein D3C77_673780 [compost metagenome]
MAQLDQPDAKTFEVRTDHFSIPRSDEMIRQVITALHLEGIEDGECGSDLSVDRASMLESAIRKV